MTTGPARKLLLGASVHRMRPLWVRALSLYRSDIEDIFETGASPWAGHPAEDHVHARSRFHRADDPDDIAVYSVHDAAGYELRSFRSRAEHHTLAVVREFRRVPLDASGLGLMLFTAAPGQAARVIAALAHWAERAVSAFQPTYVLLAHSLEQPCISAVLAGVHESRTLLAAGPTPLSLDPVLREIGPLLESVPGRYVYRPEDPATEALLPRLVSPHAV